MTINTRLEFDGAAPNGSRLQQVLDDLAAAISSLNGGSIGSPLTIVGSSNNMVLSGSSAGNPVTIAASGSDTDISIWLKPKGSGAIELGPQTGGANAGFVYANVYATGSQSGEVAFNVENWLQDVDSGFTFAGSFQTRSQGAGAAHDLMSLAALQGSGESHLPAGRTVTNVLGFEGQATNFGAGTVTNAFGTYGVAYNSSTGTIANAYAHYSLIENDDAGGTITNAYGNYVEWLKFAGTITYGAAFYAKDMAGVASNAYPFWSDTQGVYRIKADNTFDAVVQSIPALYNPQFAKYTAGATNFERGVLGQWTGNVFQITTEKGGSGTLRGMQIAATTATPLGFYGKTPIACAVLATGAGATVDNVITALQNLGLVKQS